MSIFASFKRGMQKTRDFVTNGLNKIVTGLGRFDEAMLDELEVLLIQADVGVAASEVIMQKLKDEIKATGDSSRPAVLASLKRIMLDMIGPAQTLPVQKGQLTIILVVGVNGTGKTTTAGKLCHRFNKDGLKVILAAADTFRAAAIEQLAHWGEVTGTPVISHQLGSDPAAVVFDAISAAQARKADVLLIDTAGRLHNKQNLMDELAKIRRIINRQAPDAICETLLVIDATSGQNAVQQALVFREAAAVTGLAITKLDGNAKGGVAVAVAHQVPTPLMLAGLGEGVEDLADFAPQLFIDSLLPEE